MSSVHPVRHIALNLQQLLTIAPHNDSCKLHVTAAALSHSVGHMWPPEGGYCAPPVGVQCTLVLE
eukprot:3207328-Pyramimonas_sp.AAC.1